MFNGIKHMKIMRVTKYEFETEDGQIFEHIIPLDSVPTLDEFQKMYDTCYQHIQHIAQDDSTDNE